MTRLQSHWLFSCAAAGMTLLASANAQAWQEQEPDLKEVLFQLPERPPAASTIAEVTPEGEVRVEFASGLEESGGGLSEGYYLLFAGFGRDIESARILPVQVKTIEAKSLTLQAAPSAVENLAPGERVMLLRPVGSTTAELRAIPAALPLRESQPEDRPSKAAALAQSTNNLKQIGLALHNFASARGHFPPAVVYGPDGKPWHSWRVLLLPFLEQQELYMAYDFSQPWDSEANRRVLESMPDVYRDPIHGDDDGHFTHYAAFVGDRAAFSPEGLRMPAAVNDLSWMRRGPGVRSFAEVRDGLSNTIVVGPVRPDRKIPWTKPEDINVGPDFPHLGQPGGIAAPYQAEGGTAMAPLLFMDGSVRTVTSATDPRVLQALLTINGGEVFATDQIKTGGPGPGTRPALKITLSDDGASAEIVQVPSDVDKGDRTEIVPLPPTSETTPDSRGVVPDEITIEAPPDVTDP